MSIGGTALIRRATIDELCAHRQRAIDLYRQGFETIVAARKAHAEAAPSAYVASLPDRLRLERLDDLMKEMQTTLDQDMWKSFVKSTHIDSLMDREEREKFEKSLLKDAPPATADNVYATMSRLLGDANAIFRRGLINAFARFCRDYKSNDGFKIGERIVLEHGVTWDVYLNHFRLNYYGRDYELHDLDRVMHILDGKDAPTLQNGLVAAMREDFDKREGGAKSCQTPYWRAKWFKKGTLHLFPLRDDLRMRANKLIAEEYGETLAAGSDVVGKKVRPEESAGKFTYDDWNYFPTPGEVARTLCMRAGLTASMRVLEPSAGQGHLATYIRVMVDKAALDCIEISTDRVDKLRQLGFKNVTQADFLSVSPDPVYDRVIMNPPFTKGQDALHILHALRFLKPDGELISVAGASIKTRSDRASAFVRQRAFEIIDLPPNSFEESGTAVNAVLVVCAGGLA